MQQLNSKNLKKEELHYEYKKALGGFPKSFWESFSAFANSDGGIIYLGVEEVGVKKYAPSGLTLDDVDNLKSILFSQSNNKEKVNVNLLSYSDVEEIKIDDCYALKVNVIRCPTHLRPIYINDNVYRGTFRRNSDGDYRCSIDEVNAMIRDSSIISHDLEIIDDCDLNLLDPDSIKAYKNIFASLHPDHPFLKEDTDRFLEFIGAARIDKNGEYHPTKAGLLMFGFSYRIAYYFPDYFLDYMEIGEERWKDRIHSDSGLWSGNVFSFFLEVTSRLNTFLKTPFVMNGIYRNDDNSMHKAVREALCNTLSNADYHLGGGVTIKVYEDKIEFANPGCLMLDVEQMFKGGTSIPRNRTILKMFNLINVGERSGSGIPLIVSAAKEFKLPKPIIKEQFKPNRTTLTVYFSEQKDSDKTLNRTEKDVVDYLRANGPSSAKEISSYFNKNITTIKLSLYALLDKKIISSSGTIKDKKYFI